MASIVDIYNDALNELGQTSVSSVKANTAGARAIDAVFATELDVFLEEHFWNFAKTRASLARRTATPLFGFKYLYGLPSDFLLIWQEERPNMLYRIEGGSWLCNAEEVNLVYVRRVTSANTMTGLFRRALAMRLAVRVCRKVTGANPDADLKARRDEAVRIAKLLNARNAGRMEPVRPNALLLARAGVRSGSGEGA